jgi:hypothetical protein
MMPFVDKPDVQLTKKVKNTSYYKLKYRNMTGSHPIIPIDEHEEDRKRILIEAIDAEYLMHGFTRQFERDSVIWYHTLTVLPTSPIEQNRIQILRRIFLVLRYGGLIFRSDQNTNDWRWFHDTNLPIASAISHGSRILIQLPPENELAKKKRYWPTDESDLDHDFWSWLLTGDVDGDITDIVTTDLHGNDALSQNKCIFRRLASTHGIKIIPESHHIQLEDAERRKCLREVRKKLGISARDTKIVGENRKLNKHKHWGMNLPLGGIGNASYGFHEDIITSDGRNGHLYMYYLAPRGNRNGGLLIGVEGSEYRKVSQSGEQHTIRAKSSVLSATMGYKWSKLKGLGHHGLPDKRDSMLVDLSTGWKDIITKEWRDDYVREGAAKYSSYLG